MMMLGVDDRVAGPVWVTLRPRLLKQLVGEVNESAACAEQLLANACARLDVCYGMRSCV